MRDDASIGGTVRLLAAVSAIVAGCAPWSVACAGKLKTIHAFCAQTDCADGEGPVGRLLQDATGNLFGVSGGGANAGGTVYRLAPRGHNTWKHDVLYAFCARSLCADGAFPAAGLIADTSGSLYGTTIQGGAADKGVAFKLTPNARRTKWKLTVMHSFCSEGGGQCTDGSHPFRAGLTYVGATYDGVAPLYGTTEAGGANNGVACDTQYGPGCGAAFELSPRDGGWDERVIYSFCALGGSCVADGANPRGGLIADAAGDLYGTVRNGGIHGVGGLVFELIPGAEGEPWAEASLFNGFGSGQGNQPDAGLLMDATGDLFGTTNYGGPANLGVAFRLAPEAPTYDPQMLHTFCAESDCADGALPDSDLILDSAGDLLGTTVWGGKGTVVANGGGTIFKLSRRKFTILHSFCIENGCPDGYWPSSGLIVDGAGRVFGATPFGGTFGRGTVFELVP